MRGRACKELWSARVHERARRWCDGGSGGGIGVVRQHERNSESIGAALLWPSDPAPRSPRVIHSSAPHARQQGRRLLPFCLASLSVPVCVHWLCQRRAIKWPQLKRPMGLVGRSVPTPLPAHSPI